jgi:hypothetical protein
MAWENSRRANLFIGDKAVAVRRSRHHRGSRPSPAGVDRPGIAANSREHEFGVGTIAGVAAKFGVHRRVVRRAMSSALPPAQHYPERVRPKLGSVADFIDKVLDGPGRGRPRTAQPAPHGAALDPDGISRRKGRRTDRAQPCARAQTPDGAETARDASSRKAKVGLRGAGRLVGGLISAMSAPRCRC